MINLRYNIIIFCLCFLSVIFFCTDRSFAMVTAKDTNLISDSGVVEKIASDLSEIKIDSKTIEVGSFDMEKIKLFHVGDRVQFGYRKNGKLNELVYIIIDNENIVY